MDYNSKSIWVPIIGYEKLYMISNHGVVKSLDRFLVMKNGIKRFHKGKVIAQQLVRGYRNVILHKDNKFKHFYVHRLLAMHFIDKKIGCDFVNHKNGIKTDNRIDNLEWCTQSDNVSHSYSNGLSFQQSKITKKRTKLTKKDVVKIRELHLNGLNHSELSKIFNVSRVTILSVVNKNSWRKVV